jgi:23S rRNA (adenine2503-C2)-methyltransferase
VVWRGINDKKEDALALLKFAKIIPSKVNLIEYNSIDDPSFQQATPESLRMYQEILEAEGITTRIRISRGKDIDAACGQLANK